MEPRLPLPTCPECEAPLRLEHSPLNRQYGRVVCRSCRWTGHWLRFEHLRWPVVGAPRRARS
jgi:hypothetical protein